MFVVSLIKYNRLNIKRLPFEIKAHIDRSFTISLHENQINLMKKVFLLFEEMQGFPIYLTTSRKPVFLPPPTLPLYFLLILLLRLS